MSKDNFKKVFVEYLGKLMLTMEISGVFYVALLICRAVQFFFLINEIYFFKNSSVQNIFTQNSQTFLSIILAIQVLTIVLFSFDFYFQKVQNQKENYNTKFNPHSDYSYLIKNLLKWIFLVFKFTGTIPVTWLIFKGICQGQNNLVSCLAILNGLIYFGLIYPINGLFFWNKIILKKNILSFSNSLNLQSLLYLYLPFIVTLKYFCSVSVNYVNIVFFTIFAIHGYYRPIITFNYAKRSLYGCSSILAVMIASSAYDITKIPVNSISSFIFYLIIHATVIYLITESMFERINKILFSSNFSFLQDHNTSSISIQCLLLKLLNFQTNKNNLALVLLNNFEFSDSQVQHHNHWERILKRYSQQFGIQQKESCQFSNTKEKIKDLLTGKASNSNDKQIFEFYSRLVQNFINSKFNPQALIKKNLGRLDLQKIIQSNSKVYPFVIQLLISQPYQIYSSYLRLNTYQLLISSQTIEIFSSLQISSLKSLIQQKINLQQNLNKQFNSNLLDYYYFNKNYLNLQQKISQIKQSNIVFWKELKSHQPHRQKLVKLIQKNYTLSTKIQSLYKKLTNQFDNKSYIILYQVLQKYNSYVLNNSISNIQNVFKDLVKNINIELQKLKKQGSLNSNLNSYENNYSLLAEKYACVLNLESQKYQICWANKSFCQQYMNASKENQKQVSQISVFDLIFPQLKQQYSYYFKLFKQTGRINSKLANTFWYQKNTKIYQNVHIEFQVIPSIKQGLRLSMFGTKIQKSRKHPLKVLLKQENLEFVGYTQGMKDEIEQMVIPGKQLCSKEQQFCQVRQFVQLLKKNQEFLEMISKIKHRNNIECQFQQQQAGQLNKQTKKSFSQVTIQLQNSDYKLILKTKIPYFTFQTEQNTKFQQKNLLQFQIINLLLAQKQPSAHQQTDKFFFKTISDTNMIPFNKSTTINLSPISQKNLKFNKQEQNQLQNTYEKQLNLNKVVLSVNRKKIPSKIFWWRIFTIILIFFINVNMLVNVVISVNRKQVYLESKNMVQNYNLIMSGTTEILTTLREYNFYAYTHGSENERIPYFVNYLVYKQQLLAQQIRQISGFLTNQWQTFKMSPLGFPIYYFQKAYIIIINFVLSPITFIARSDPKQMQFPFLLSQFNWFKALTPVQSNYFQATGNGLYSYLFNLITQRFNLNQQISKQILPIQKQQYIYPTLFGIGFILIFITISLCIQAKSFKTKSKFMQLLEYIPIEVINKKIKRLQQFSIQTQKDQTKTNKFTVKNMSQQQNPLFAFKNLTKIIDFDNFKQKSLSKSINSQQASNNLNYETETNRQFYNQEKVNEPNFKIDQLSIQIKRNTNAQKTRQFSTNKIFSRKKVINKDQILIEKRLNLEFQSMSCLKKIIFYLLICLPFLVYFVVIFVGGKQLNQNIMTYIKTSSQLHYRKTKLQYAYLWLRQTALLQPMFTSPDFDWNSIMIFQNTQCYAQQKLLAGLLSEIDQNTQLNKYLHRIQNSNLCNQLNTFTPSLKYNITFSLQQCQSLSHSVLTQGLRPTIVAFLQSVIQFIQKYPNAVYLTYQQRLQFLQGQQLQTTRKLLIYLQQIFDKSLTLFSMDFANLIQKYISMTIIYSIISAIVIFYLFYAINYRWKLMIKQKKQVKSIINIISINSIKQNDGLRRYVETIDCGFYD